MHGVGSRAGWRGRRSFSYQSGSHEGNVGRQGAGGGGGGGGQVGVGPGASSGRRPELQKQTQGGGKRKHSGASGLSAGCQRCHVEAARPKLIWEVFPWRGRGSGQNYLDRNVSLGPPFVKGEKKREKKKKAARVNSHFFFFFFNWHVTQHGLYTASYPGKDVYCMFITH